MLDVPGPAMGLRAWETRVASAYSGALNELIVPDLSSLL